MSSLSPAGVTGTTGSRYRSPHAPILPMTLLCPAGSATPHAINIIVHSYWLIRPEPSATKTALRCGTVLEMAVFAAPLVMIMAEV